MSQERQTRSTPRAKSPSRIPRPVATPTPPSSSQGKRPVSRLALRDSVAAPPTKQLTGFKKLQAMAQAEVRNRGLQQGTSQDPKAGPSKIVPWVDKHLPKSVDDLFVHKKKVEEVISWFNRTLSASSSRTPKICVLSGPSGSGKTATVHLVAKSLDAEVKEWINPMSLSDFRFGENDGFRDDVQSRNQVDLFADFLFRTSQYRSLPIKGNTAKKYRLILVEDIPNALYRQSNTFHEILRKYSAAAISPLVFVYTDTVSSEHNLFKMFPKSILTDLNIHSISFNPVASSLMVKFLLDICSKESMPVDKSSVENIANTTNGDIRCAINNLQFALTNEKCSSRVPTFRRPPNKRARKDKSSEAEVQQKDETIQLFRALGKVLYAKRDDAVINEIEMQLQGDMEEHRRLRPLIENPEHICDKAVTSTDTFINFLHQNYPAFYGSLDDMRHAAEYLGVGDFIVSGWKFDDSGCKSFKVRDVKEQVAMSVAVRGLMHSNNHRVSVGWKPLTKPSVVNLDTQTRQKIESTREALTHFRELQLSLFTEAIPYFAKLLKNKPSLHLDGKKEILDLGLFQQKFTTTVPLDEKEIVELDDESEGGEAEESGGAEAGKQSTQKLCSGRTDDKKTSDLITGLYFDDKEDEYEIEDFDD